MHALLIALLTFVAVVAIGGSLISAANARKKAMNERLRLRGQEPQADPPGTAKPGAGIADVLQRIGRVISSGKTSSSLRQQLARAGYHGDRAPTMYLGSKAVLFVGSLVLIGVLVGPLHIPFMAKPLIILTVATVLFFVPNMVVSSCHKRRSGEVTRHLPNVVDLLEVCISSGLGMDMAWNLVTDEMRTVSMTLADEMALTNLEIHLGATRVTAMRNLADRTGANDIGSLVAVLVQSEQFGTSISDALGVFASSMRETRSLKAQESAERMAVRLLFPMVLFIFPAMMIVLAGPTGIVLSKIMGSN